MKYFCSTPRDFDDVVRGSWKHLKNLQNAVIWPKKKKKKKQQQRQYNRDNTLRHGCLLEWKISRHVLQNVALWTTIAQLIASIQSLFKISTLDRNFKEENEGALQENAKITCFGRKRTNSVISFWINVCLVDYLHCAWFCTSCSAPLNKPMHRNIWLLLPLFVIRRIKPIRALKNRTFNNSLELSLSLPPPSSLRRSKLTLPAWTCESS